MMKSSPFSSPPALRPALYGSLEVKKNAFSSLSLFSGRDEEKE